MNDDTTTATPPSAIEVEATDAETIDLVFHGETYTVPATPDAWDIETLEEFEQGHAAAAISAILGPKQYRLFKSRHKVKGFNEFSEVLGAQYGFKTSGN